MRKIRPGLIVTVLICIMEVVFWKEVVSTAAIGIMVIRGQPRHCPLGRMVGSYAATTDQLRGVGRIKASARLIKREAAGYDLYDLAAQRVWVPSGSLSGAIDDTAEQERGIYDYDGSFPRAGAVVLDGGANIGLYARHALRRGASKVVAIEPVPANLECLRRNLEEEILAGKVVLYPKGVWDKDGILEMSLNPENHMADSFVLNQQKGISMKLPLTTIDKLVEELHLQRVDLIKLDIEGAERQALSGAKNTIRKFRPKLAVCVYHLPDDTAVIPAVIRSIRSDYRQGCGACMFFEYTIRPQVYFYF